MPGDTQVSQIEHPEQQSETMPNRMMSRESLHGNPAVPDTPVFPVVRDRSGTQQSVSMHPLPNHTDLK